MRVVLQKVSQASVAVAGKQLAAIQKGYLLLVGVEQGDGEAQADYLAKKIANLRVFEDAEDKMNLSIGDVQGQVLSISQFTLLANTKKGNRPSFVKAEQPAKAAELYEYFNQQLEQLGLIVGRGSFGAHMEINLINDGPVTILFDTNE